MGLLKSLNEAFRYMDLSEKDEPAMELARIYAEKIELARDDKTLKDLGSDFAKLLSELMMTPKARAALTAQVKEVASDDEERHATFAAGRAAATARYQRPYGTQGLHSPTP